LNKPPKDKLVNDIENRLDDFFGETTVPERTESSPGSIEKLKSVVLSIDWEITDNCLHDLIKETDDLLPAYINDPPSHALLRMLQALGRYIQKRKAQSHPDAIKRIMSVFKSFEQVTQAQISDEQLKKRIIAKEINAFKNLKEQVEVQRKAAEISTRGQKIPSDLSGYVDHQKLKQAMSVVEQKLNKKVDTLTAKLADLQKDLDSIRKA
jgi:pilus assembly protein FimV